MFKKERLESEFYLLVEKVLVCGAELFNRLAKWEQRKNIVEYPQKSKINIVCLISFSEFCVQVVPYVLPRVIWAFNYMTVVFGRTATECRTGWIQSFAIKVFNIIDRK